MKLNMMIFIPLIGLVLAQDDARIEAGCFRLTSDSICGPEFEGQPVDSPNRDFKSTLDFNENIQLFSNETYMAKQYFDEFGCSFKDLRKMISYTRFTTSFWCSFYVDIAKRGGCKPKNDTISNGPTLCRTQCGLHIISVTDIVSQCPNTTAVNDHIRNMMNYCTSTDPTDQNSQGRTCSKGVEIEYKYCGWASLKIGQEACKRLSKQDKCCLALLQVQEEERTSLSWWVILLIVIAVLAMLIGLYMVIRYSRKKSSESNSTDNMKKSSKADIMKDEENLVGILTKPNSNAEILSSNSKIGLDEGPVQNSLWTSMIKDSKTHKKISSKDSKPSKKSFFDRFQKTYPSLADDLEKARANGDQSINSLMKFFGAGNMDRNRKDQLELAAAFPVPPRPDASEDLKVSSGENTELESGKKGEPITEKESTREETSSVRTSSTIQTRSEAADFHTETGETVVVIGTYEGKCDDELNLVIGELIYIKKEFDDGWAVGIEQKSKKEGVFPLMCTAKLVETSGKE